MLRDIINYFTLGWIQENYFDPIFHFKFYGFSWVTAPSYEIVTLAFFCLGLLALCVTLGYLYRFAIILFFLLYTYIILIEVTVFVEWNYLIALISFLLIFLPANNSLSIDIKQNRVKPLTYIPYWNLWILQFQFGIVYLFGGISKLNVDWIRGDLVTGWLSHSYSFFGNPIIITSKVVIQLLTWSGIFFDLFIIFFLFWRRTRIIAFIATLFFHIHNIWLLPVGIFPYLMIIGTALFLAPDALDKSKNHELNFSHNQFVLICLSAYCLIQLLLPLRHFLYPGNPNWTEEGTRCSWFLYTRHKRTAAQFVIINKNGETYTLNRERILKILTPRQYKYMLENPNLILQFSHFLAKTLEEQGEKPEKIMAQVKAAMNMRPQQWFINPNANLLDFKQSFRHKTWIVPLE